MQKHCRCCPLKMLLFASFGPVGNSSLFQSILFSKIKPYHHYHLKENHKFGAFNDKLTPFCSVKLVTITNSKMQQKIQNHKYNLSYKSLAKSANCFCCKQTRIQRDKYLSLFFSGMTFVVAFEKQIYRSIKLLQFKEPR